MDAYRVGVKIALENGVSPVLAIIGTDLLGLNASIKKVEDNFKGWGTAILGVGAILAGGAILGGIVKIMWRRLRNTRTSLLHCNVYPEISARPQSLAKCPRKHSDTAKRIRLKVEIPKNPGRHQLHLSGR